MFSSFPGFTWNWCRSIIYSE